MLRRRMTVVAFLFLMLIVSGCNNREPKALVLIAGDTSGSMTEDEKRDACGPARRFSDRFHRRANVIVSHYATTCEKLHVGRPYDAEDLRYAFRDIIMTSPPKDVGTYQAVALEQFISDIEHQETQLPVIALLLTDGEDMAPQRTRQAAARLARLPVRLICAGPV